MTSQRTGPAAKRPQRGAPPAQPSGIRLHAADDFGASPRLMIAGLVVIAIAGVTLLWLALGFHRVGDYLTESDFYGGYAPGAAMIREGKLDPSRYAVVGPVYEIAVAAIGFVVPDLFTAAKLLSVAAACGTLVLWLVLLSRLGSAATGLWTIVLLAANPEFTRYGFSATTDMLATCFQAACFFALFASRGRYALLASGLFAGLAALTRYNAAILVPAVIAYIAWRGVAARGVRPAVGEPEATGTGREKPQVGSRLNAPGTPRSDAAPASASGLPRMRAAAIFLAGFAVVAGPWLAFSLSRGQVPGALLVRNFVYYATPDAARNIQDWPGDLTGPEAPTTSLGELVRRDAGKLVVGALRAVPDHLRMDAGVLLGWPVAIVCLLGLAFLIFDRRHRALAPLWIPWAALFLTLVPVFYSPRYSLPLAPFYLSLAGVAIAAPRFALSVGRVPLKWLIVLLPVALTLQRNVAHQQRLENQTPVEVIEAGRALRDAAPPGARVVSRKGHIGYYSGLDVAPFPRLASLRELAEHCERNRAEFLYFSWLETQLRPDFSYLLDTTAAVPGLSVVHATEHGASVTYRIGAGFGQDPAWFGDPVQSRLHWARVLARALPDSLAAPYRNLLAAFALDRGQAEEALALADRATRDVPRDTLGWAIKGQALRQLGRPAEAERAFEAALALDPDEIQSRIGLGWVQLAQGRFEDAARTWRPAITQTRDDLTLRSMQSLFDSLGDQEAARAAAAARR